MSDRNHTTQVIDVFSVDPDLGDSLSGDDLKRARAHARARVVWVKGPSWDPEPVRRLASPRWLGLFVVSGLMMRCVSVGPRSACELFGPGDLLRPWDADGEYEPVPVELEWRIPNGVELAVLDDAFAMRIREWPSIMSRLLARVATRARTLAITQAISHLNRADTRLLFLFWLLAERWGVVTPDGVAIELPLTHEVLAMLAGVRRPSATIAISRLTDDGLLMRPERRRWLLTKDAVDLLRGPESLRLLEHGPAKLSTGGRAQAARER
jgi:CRP/FNR family cyclic AMP-dependent transcriptional regulator